MAAVVAVTAGCSASSNTTGSKGGSASSSSKTNYIVVSGPVSDPYFQPMKLGSDDAAKQFGINYQYSAATNYDNITSDYSKLLTEAIAKKPSGLVVWDSAPTVIDPLVKQATSEGIPVVMISSGLDTWQADGAITFVGEDHTVTGLAAGTAAAKTGVTHLLCVNNAASNPDLQQRCDGAETSMKKAGGTSVQIIIPASDVNSPSATTTAIQGYLSSHPDIDGVWTQSAAIGTDVTTAVQNLNEKGKIKVSTLGLTKEVLADVKNGTLASAIDGQQYLQGFYALEILNQYVKYGLYPTAPVLPGALAVDKDNIAQVEKIQSEYPGVRGGD
ncbi:MAG TPA: substrate-binding domain-containing protein [Galbitalea sp.]|nr:substrate-binding domain-containing protein [Galbitalea sp.]